MASPLENYHAIVDGIAGLETAGTTGTSQANTLAPGQTSPAQNTAPATGAANTIQPTPAAPATATPASTANAPYADLSQPAQDTFNNQPLKNEPLQAQTTDKKSDGKFSILEAGKNFAKGLLSPVTQMFSSTKNFLIGVGTMAAGAGLIVATGGAAAPALLALGLGLGGFQLGKGIYKFTTAANGDEREQAFSEIGAGSSAIALSAVGAKSSLKASGVSVDKVNDMGFIRATVENVRQTPQSAGKSFSSLRYGDYRENLANTLGALRKYKPEHGQETTPSATLKTEAELQRELLIGEKKDQYAPLGDALAKEHEANYPGAYKEVKDTVGKHGRVVGRDKSATSTTDKLARESVDEGVPFTDADSARPYIRDSIGTRLILKQGESIDNVVASMAEAITEGRLEVTHITNYRGPGGKPYLSKENINTLLDAVDAARANGHLPKEHAIILTNEGSKAAPGVEIGGKGVRDSGYTSAQFNIRHKNGALGELQIRGEEVHRLSEMEHLIYDMREGKQVAPKTDAFEASTTLRQNLDDLYSTIRSLSDDQYNAYQGYLNKHYLRTRAMEAGADTIPEIPVLPDNLGEYPSLDLAHVRRLHGRINGEKLYQKTALANIAITPAVTSGLEPFSSEQELSQEDLL